MDTRTRQDTDACVLLAAVAALLADGGRPAVPAALDELVRGLGLRSAVLRDPGPDGELRTVAGEVLHAVPRARLLEPVPAHDSVLELPVHVAGRLVRTLTVIGARPSQLPALRAAAAVLGLALSARPPSTSGLALAVLRAGDDDASDAADALHDGPVQDLVAARYAIDAAARGGDPTSIRDAVQTALVGLRRALWLLRPRGDAGLGPALTGLSAHLAEAGRPALSLTLDEAACAQLSAQAASTGYRMVQAVACPPGAAPVAVTVRQDGLRLILALDGGAPLPARDRWSVRARALGADLFVPPPPGTGLLLSVPVHERPEQKATP